MQSDTPIIPEEPQVFSRQDYAKHDFWDQRYSGKKVFFDWYVEWPDLKKTMEQGYGIEKSSSILMVGCGNSKLSEQMYDDGYRTIVNIDISQTVIDQMKETYDKKGKKMEWVAMDATNMQFDSEVFDVVLDKGTLDAVICGKDLTISTAMLHQCRRVVKPTGHIIVVTHGGPQGRKKVFQQPLPFNQFDYEFVKLGLSDNSMLINLMRSNLKDKPLKSILTDAQAMKKSLVEFKILQQLKRKKKLTKFTIYWSAFETKQVQKLGQEPNSEETTPQSNSPQQTHTYRPVKQSFCYVYNIQLKPHISISYYTKKYKYLQDAKQDKIFQALDIKSAVHDQQFKTIQVNPQTQECVMISADRPWDVLLAIKHAQQAGWKLPRIVVGFTKWVESLQQVPTKQQSIIARIYFKFLKEEQFQVSVISSVNQHIRIKDVQIDEIRSAVNMLAIPEPPFILKLLEETAKKMQKSIDDVKKQLWHPHFSISDAIEVSLPPTVDIESLKKYNIQHFPGYIMENPEWLKMSLWETRRSYCRDEENKSTVCRMLDRSPKLENMQYVWISEEHAPSTIALILRDSVKHDVK